MHAMIGCERVCLSMFVSIFSHSGFLDFLIASAQPKHSATCPHGATSVSRSAHKQTPQPVSSPVMLHSPGERDAGRHDGDRLGVAPAVATGQGQADEEVAVAAAILAAAASASAFAIWASAFSTACLSVSIRPVRSACASLSERMLVSSSMRRTLWAWLAAIKSADRSAKRPCSE